LVEKIEIQLYRKMQSSLGIQRLALKKEWGLLKKGKHEVKDGRMQYNLV
jgi:hypothetical protein